MNLVKKKTQASLIALLLMLTITATSIFVALPSANAHTPPWTVPTWCYCAVSPTTVGVGQQVLVVFWINQIPPTANGQYGDRWSFTLTVTKPDGKIDTLGPLYSDPVGGSYTSYTPDQIGHYTFVAHHPQEVPTGTLNNPLGANPAGVFTLSGTYVYQNDTIEASDSQAVYLSVQETPVQSYQETPLPTDYWTRPIYGANRLWGVIAGDWLGGADVPPNRANLYSQGPESSHILWTKQYWSGGVMGGGATINDGSYGYYTGMSYESFSSPSICLDGRLYYSVQTPPRYGWYCVDLYTGETLYYQNNTDGTFPLPAMGQMLFYDSPNQHGGFDYLWQTSGVGTNTWQMLDGFTGNAICKIANVSSSGTAFNDNIGSICRLNIVNLGNTTNPNLYLQIWNTTQAIMVQPLTAGSNNYWMWRPTRLAVYDGRNGFSLNASIPAVQGSILSVRADKEVIGGTSGKNNGTYVLQGNLWALNLDPTNGKPLGSLLWNITYTPPQMVPDIVPATGFVGTGAMTGPAVDVQDGVFLFSESILRERWCYSLKDGSLLWGPSEPEADFNFYGMGSFYYNGRLYSTGYSGILLAYNITTGHVDWNWTAPFVGLDESPYPYTPLSLGCVADGKLYLYSTEHSPTEPLRRDAKLYCVNADNGTLIWSLTCWPSGSPIIADGIILALDLHDNQIYAYGKGASATTISALQSGVSVGSVVTITGTVIDDTPSGKDKGTPAIGDASMDAWMEYLYHQRPIPSNAKGVPVSLDTIDPNGNFVHIGDVTSDLHGNYGLSYTPQVPGTYQIIATFQGSKAYGSSSDTTYLAVGEAAPPASPYPVTVLPPTEMYIIGAAAAIIIAIAIVGVVLALMIRKRP